VDGLKIILGEQMERAEQLVVFQIERPCGLEVAFEGRQSGRLDDELFGCSNLAELLLVLSSRDSGLPPRSAPMMVVRVRVDVRCMVRAAVVEVL